MWGGVRPNKDLVVLVAVWAMPVSGVLCPVYSDGFTQAEGTVVGTLDDVKPPVSSYE